MKWFKKYLPETFEFFRGFFLAMNNNPVGQSLKKWLAVGFFWLTAYVVYNKTTPENATAVLTILTSMITALVITNSVSNHKKRTVASAPNITTPPTP